MSRKARKEVIGERFKNLRKYVAINEKVPTQKELSKELNIANTRISAIEKGKDEATLAELIAYHKKYNVPIEYLLGLTDTKEYANIKTCNELGLSDKAIQTLEKWNSHYPYENFTFVLNYLFEADLMKPFLMRLHRYLYGDVERFVLKDKINHINYHRSNIELIENKEDDGQYEVHVEGGNFEHRITIDDLNELHEISLIHAIKQIKDEISKNPKLYKNLLHNFTFHGRF